MDWQAFRVSIEMALATCLLLVPLAIPVARWLASTPSRVKWLVEVLILLPMILPPTVVGFYLLNLFGSRGVLGRFFETVFGTSLAFHWEGLVLASVVFNLPFAIYPIQRAYAAIPASVRDAAQLCGLSPARIMQRIELPLVLPGIFTALILVFTHTLGEFGVVLMVGGNIPGETRTLAIAIYDSVQSFQLDAADRMSFYLLLFCATVIWLLGYLSRRQFGRGDDFFPM